MKWLLYLICFSLIGCNTISWPESVTTSFEEFEVLNDTLWLAVGEGHISSSGKIDLEPFQGTHSLFAASGEQVVFEYAIDNPEPDSKYLVTVWCKSSGKRNGGVAAALEMRETGPVELAMATDPADVRGEWKMIELLVQLSPEYSGSPLIIQLRNDGNDPVWFDEFKLEFLEKVYYPEFSEEETLQLQISEPDLIRMRNLRLEAFEKGYIEMDKEDWVRVDVRWNEKELRGSMVLKGDRLYNLQGDKWSLKVELDEGEVMGMRYFSLQNPALQNFIDEWLFHELLQQEDIVSANYGFVPVSLNGRSLGVYAFEERIIDETFVTRDTVNAIARFKDIGWAKVRDEMVNDPEADLNEPFEEAKIQIFRDDAFDKSLKTEFEKQLADFRNVTPGVSNVFNLEKTARMLAVCDLMAAWNALHWTNIRFISDAVTGKIELVGNDAFANFGSRPFRDVEFMAYSDKAVLLTSVRWKAMYLSLFNDPDFLALYVNELKRLSDKKYLNVFKLNTFEGVKQYQGIIMKEWPSYRYDYSELYDRARDISKQLEGFDADSANTQFVFEPEYGENRVAH